MGCDIHCYAERRIDQSGDWSPMIEPVVGDDGQRRWPAVYHDRNYDIFAILANVRNGRGFAGIQTGEEFNFISEPKGLPDDLCSEYRHSHGCETNEDGEPADGSPYLCFGDHSFSFLTLRELLSFDYDQIHVSYGVVDREEFDTFDDRRKFAEKYHGDSVNVQPQSWCGSVSGPTVAVLEETEYRAVKENDQFGEGINYQVRTAWQLTYAHVMRRFFEVVVCPMLSDAVRRGIPIEKALDQYRIVFGFDS